MIYKYFALLLFISLQAVELTNHFFHAKKVVGISTVTSSETEGTDIPALWDRFRQEIYATLPQPETARIYVIYTNYTGDCRRNNPYTVVIGLEDSATMRAPAETIAVTIPATQYAVAQANGNFPDNVISLWDAIFASGFQQKHTINFEIFEGDLDRESNVKIYLAI